MRITGPAEKTQKTSFQVKNKKNFGRGSNHPSGVEIFFKPFPELLNLVKKMGKVDIKIDETISSATFDEKLISEMT